MREPKKSFIQHKRMKKMLEEQIKIFEKLPDGAIIHKPVSKDETPGNNVSALERIKLEINYFNESFFNMFATLQEK